MSKLSALRTRRGAGVLDVPVARSYSSLVPRSLASLAVTAVAAAGIVGLTASAEATQNTVPIVTNLRTGGHSGFDRVVIDYRHPSYATKPTTKVRWVSAAYQCGSGKRVTLPGNRILTITMTHAQAHRDDGSNAYVGPGRLATSAVNLTTVKGVRMICDFEGQVAFAIGTQNAKGFSTGSLSDPKRFYVDIKR